jgi:hypothetical protein
MSSRLIDNMTPAEKLDRKGAQLLNTRQLGTPLTTGIKHPFTFTPSHKV